MKHQIVLRAPDSEPVSAEVPEHGSLLVGREPAAKSASVGGATSVVEASVTIPSARVSSHHITVESAGADVVLTDLGSRNGSWLRLPPLSPVRVSASPLVLELALPTVYAASTGPDDVHWDPPAEFGPAVEREARSWLKRQRIDARVERDTGRRPRSDARVALWLADGSELLVARPVGATLTSGWIEQLSSWVHAQNAAFEMHVSHGPGFVMASSSFREAHRKVFDAAIRGIRVLLLGETGCGKEVLARCYHEHSPRRSMPFVALNCGAMPDENLLLADLFGMRARSVSNVDRDLEGAVEVANGGTLFLDELGDTPMAVQVALLRFLESGEYRRFGDNHRVRRSDVAVVAATNRGIEEMVERRAFREDLWFRLNGVKVEVPPLRERREDIRAFLEQRQVRPGLSAWEALSPPARELALAHRWPGNLRELSSFVERIDMLMEGSRCTEAECRKALQIPPSKASLPPAIAPTPAAGIWDEVLNQATATWLRDNTSPPDTWKKQEEFFERYVKPLFLAYAGNVRHVMKVDRSVNLTRLAADVGLRDDQRAKHYLAEYVERFSTAEVDS